MYLIEGKESGFTSIPVSIYWTIVTLTTVGYGDISPQTPLGQIFASLVMILGYGIIAVPTGIITAEFAKRNINPNTELRQFQNYLYHRVIQSFKIKKHYFVIIAVIN